MKRLLSILLIGMGLLSCEDEPKRAEVVEEDVWQENTNFQFELKNQYNSWSAGEDLYMLGRNELTTVSSENGNWFYEHALLWLKYDLNHQMPIADRVFVAANGVRVRFASTRNPVLSGSDFYLQMLDVDPSFTAFDFPGFDFGEAIQIDGQNRVLIPYVASDDLESAHKLLIVQLEVVADESRDDIDTLSTQIIPSLGPTIALHEFRDAFYVTHSQGTFQIDRDGNIVLLLSNRPFYKMFEVDGVLFGVTDSALYRSTNGLNWVLASENDELWLLRYRQVGDFSMGFYNSQLFLLEVVGDILQITELDNAGLEGHEITSLSVFGDQVVVTTFSGVFEKPLSTFDTPRVAEGGS